MSSPLRPPSPADQAWADLAAQLTPANSLARIDTVTSRAITTITVLGTLLTGLGALAAGQFTASAAAQDLAAATVATAALAVACALAAQVLTITRHLNPANLADVQAWYWRQVHPPRLHHPGRHNPAHRRRPAGRRHRRHHHPHHHPLTRADSAD